MDGIVGRSLSLAALCGAAGVFAGQAVWAAEPSGAAENAAPKTEAVPNTDVGNSGGSLSDKLNATGGVIHPQGTVDPGIQKPPPATGTMRVIPPPGSPGGAPGVQPK